MSMQLQMTFTSGAVKGETTPLDMSVAGKCEGLWCTPQAPYLMVTHIPFARRDDGAVVVDTLWAKDLRELAARLGFIRVAAPCMTADHPDFLWGTGKTAIQPSEPFQFITLPNLNQEPLGAVFRFYAQLKEAAKGCRIVHTSNVFGRYLVISWFHRWCVKQGLPTVYVVPEDFSDMLRWEWARVPSPWLRLKRLATVRLLEFAARETAASADLTLCFGGSALALLRPTAKNPVVIHHALQEPGDCLDDAGLAEKQARIRRSEPLQLVIAARHHGLKGIDHALHMVAMLKARDLLVILRVYGQGPETANYRNLAERLDITDRVFFPGPVEHGPALYQALRDADLALMLHRTNDFGRAVYDAMASGTPVLAYATETAKAVLRDRIDGILATRDHIAFAADMLEWLHHNRPLIAEMAGQAVCRSRAQTTAFWNDYRAMATRLAVAGREHVHPAA